MKRIIRVTAIVATVALSGTVALAVAASSAPPRVDHIATVVTDRPVRESAQAPVSTATTDTASAPQATPSATAPTASQTTSLRTVVQSAVTPRGNPQVIKVPGIHVDPPVTTTPDHADHEVVVPPVRDDTDDHENKHDNGSTTDSVQNRTFNSFEEMNPSTKGD
jgi:hypothetical protein